jgi:hypothetical protein
MAKYLLLKHYRGAPASLNDVPMDEWTPEEVSAHVQSCGTSPLGSRAPASWSTVRRSPRRARSSATTARGAAGNRRPVRGDQGSDRRLDGDRRRDLRAGARSWPASCQRRPAPVGSRSASGSRCARSWPHPRPSWIATVDEALLRSLTPTVLGILVRRGADFAAAEDAVQDAVVQTVRVWPDDPPRDPKGWLVTVAWRKFLDAARADTARRHREVRIEGEPLPDPGEVVDDTLRLYFLCAHPSLTPA